jgi:signal transduction histidine kinase/CheY-like chemotaxis protein/HPt (histidine-containing phosphotransfer) domain-containing protein
MQLKKVTFWFSATALIALSTIGVLLFLIDVEMTQLPARLRGLILLAQLCMGVTVVLVLASAWILRTQVLYPLRQLNTVADRLAAGEYVTRVRMSGGGKNIPGRERRQKRTLGVAEITALGNTMNSMARSIDRDIQARAQVQQELEIARQLAEDATRSKSIFLANMSHEIRTPMNAIIGMTYLALQTELSKRQHDYLSKTHTAARALLGIINSILDFSKIEAGKIRLERVDFRLEDVLANAVVLLRQGAFEKDVELVLDCADPLLLGSRTPLTGDPLRLGEVITNLLSNAVKFTEHGHVILRVQLEAYDDAAMMLHFIVEDTGIGIAPDQVSMLFGEFTQADSSTTRRYGGTGLGLYISKKLVGLMDGRIWVDSTPQQGSRFHFTARIARAPDLRRVRPAPERLTTLRILVVDDHAEAARCTAALLRSLGVGQVDVCLHAADAYARVCAPSAPRYDLMLVDWLMPQRDGAGLLRQFMELQAHQGSDSLRLPMQVVLSGSDSNLMREHAGRLGVTHFLAKPLLASELRNLLDEFTGQPQDRRNTPSPLAGDGSLLGMRVLLVEDNLVNRQLAEEFLRTWGVKCECAEDGEAALAILRERDAAYFHLVLTDLQMPRMDGFELTRRIRAESRYAALPIVALTADVLQIERDRSMALGMVGYLTKPLEPEQLFAMLAEHFTVQQAAARREPGRAGTAPRIDGIDSVAGLRRAGGKLTLYHQSLVGFSATYVDLPATMTRLIDTRSWDSAHRQAHDFKSMSATVGATALVAPATALELACKAADREHAIRLLATLAPLLDQAVNAIATACAMPEAVDAAPGAPLLEQKTWDQLRHLLGQSDSKAILLWEQYERAFMPFLPQQTWSQIGVALRNIDFDRALELLPEKMTPFS